MNILLAVDSVIPAFAYGGTERVVWYLGKELVKAGHHVTFLARKGSKCGFADVIWRDGSLSVKDQIPEGTDIVHFNNTVPDGFDLPHIVTYHGNFLKGSLDINAVFVSGNHASRYGSRSFVYNGLDWDDYKDADINAPKEYFHFLGNAAWSVKNVRGAIDVVKELGHERLYVLGGKRLNFKMGFRFTLTPKAVFKGMVGGGTKISLLSRSKGLVFPVLWDEPFGLAITESLYCGAPVFGTPYGSLPEIVIPDVGYLSDTACGLADHIRNSYDYRPEVCRSYASDVFCSRVMAESYLAKYETVLNGGKLNPSPPHAIVPDSRKPWNSACRNGDFK